jgi:Glycosyl transferase family 2
MSIICVLNTFIRPFTFEEQLNAVLSQTVPPKRIIVWNNNPDLDLSKYKSVPNIIIIQSSMNLGVWARFFSLYYLLEGEYICVFDDDTIPGNCWFENCISTMKQYNALIGTIGVYFNKGHTYSVIKRYGWDGPSNDVKFVDIVGHSWFFKKEWISTLIRELPNIDEHFLTCGEDIHLSYTLAKYLNIPTVVAPHPEHDNSLWGSQKDTALHYGNINSTFCSTGIDKFSEVLKYYIDKGFETIFNKSEFIKTYDNCLDYFLNKIKNGYPFSLSRFADGEYYVLENMPLTNIDNWTFSTGSILCDHLNDSLKMIQTNFFYGISGLTDNESMCNYYYSKIVNQHNITYANIFVNQNFHKWKSFLESTLMNCVLISSSHSDKIGAISVIEHVPIHPFLVNIWDTKCQEYFDIMAALGKKYTGTLFLISAGPISCIFIQKLYQANPNNTYIDVGSSIDVYTKNTYTREYQYNINKNGVKDLPIIF